MWLATKLHLSLTILIVTAQEVDNNCIVMEMDTLGIIKNLLCCSREQNTYIY